MSRKLKAADVFDIPFDPFILCGTPCQTGSDLGPEFIAAAVQEWSAAAGDRSACLAPRQPAGGSCRKLQRPPEGRAARRGPGYRDRKLAPPLWLRSPAWIAGPQTTGVRGLRSHARRVALRPMIDRYATRKPVGPIRRSARTLSSLGESCSAARPGA